MATPLLLLIPLFLGNQAVVTMMMMPSATVGWGVPRGVTLRGVTTPATWSLSPAGWISGVRLSALPSSSSSFSSSSDQHNHHQPTSSSTSSSSNHPHHQQRLEGTGASPPQNDAHHHLDEAPEEYEKRSAPSSSLPPTIHQPSLMQHQQQQQPQQQPAQQQPQQQNIRSTRSVSPGVAAEQTDQSASTSSTPSTSPPPSYNVTAAVEKKIRVAKAQAEIDRILKGPEPPFDLEAELKRVKSIAPPSSTTATSMPLSSSSSLSSSTTSSPATASSTSTSPTADDDLMLEEVGMALVEQDLYQAVKQQDYRRACQIKAEISQTHIDDCGAVLQVNAEFYRAFSQKDYRAMEAVWLHDDTSTCIHPSSPPLVGAKAVLASWKRMFHATDGGFQKNWMEPHQIRLSVKGSHTAIVVCDEHVFCRRFMRGKKRQTELVNRLMATNVFRKVAGRWRLCHHHASWHFDSAAAQAALRATTATPTAENRAASSTSSATFSRASGRPSRRGPHPGSTARDNQEEEEGIDHQLAMDGILGINNIRPLLGDEGGPDEEAKKKKPVKRIIMSSLSDVLNGNINDLLLGGSAGKGANGQDNAAGYSIINFSQGDDDDDDEEVDDLVDELTDDDDDDDDDDEDDDDDPVVAVVEEWSDAEGESSNSTSTSNSAPKDALRQSCISALRKLCNQGSISPKQKQVLLTDIITCSAKGEFSMVEVAYELLCGEGDDKEAAEVEFADQCRVFAHSLPETPVIQPQN